MKDRLISLLRSSERYTKLDMVYFASGNFWQTFGQVVNSILALALLLIFANFLPKETYGTYRYLLSLAGLLNIFTLSGMSQAVAQAVSNGHEGALRTSVRYQLKWNSLLMLVFLTLGGYYLFRHNYAVMGGLLVLGLCVPLVSAFNTYGAYLGGRREFRLHNLFSVLSTLIYVAGMIVAIFLSGKVIWLVAAYALTALASNALFYFVTLRRFKPPLEPAEDTLRYGRHLTYINLMAPVVSQLDSIILNHFWGAAPLAVYSIAMAIPNRAVPFVKSWVDVSFPKLATKTLEEIHATLYRRIAQGMLFGLVMTGCYVFVAPYLFKYFLPQYLDAVFYTQVLSLMFIFSVPNRYIATLFAAQKMSRHLFVIGAVQSAFRLFYYIVLGIWGGILGLVIAQVAGTGTNFLISMVAWYWRKM